MTRAERQQRRARKVRAAYTSLSKQYGGVWRGRMIIEVLAEAFDVSVPTVYADLQRCTSSDERVCQACLVRATDYVTRQQPHSKSDSDD